MLRDGRRLLAIPDLTLAAGQSTAVVGPSGAGKSTLLRLLAGLEAPDQGKVHAVGSRSEPLGPGQVVMMFQRPLLVRGTVEENVALGLRLRGERMEWRRVTELLERLGMAKKRGQSVRTLSGGEYQRVALARALVLQPAALLLDEPTANLDPENVALIESLVCEAQAENGTTVVWVTHNPPQAARVARSVLLFVAGEIVEHSPTERFFGPEAAPRTREFLGGKMVW